MVAYCLLYIPRPGRRPASPSRQEGVRSLGGLAAGRPGSTSTSPSVRSLACMPACRAPLHQPFPNTTSVRHHRQCVFMTGVSHDVLSQLPGLLCIAHRLQQVGSRVPLVIAVPAEEALLARTFMEEAGVNATLVVWTRFPVELKLAWRQRRWKGKGVLDKLNILGAPFRRVIWLDTDVLVRRNIDELCSSREMWGAASFAAAVNSGFEPRTCWLAGGDRCEGCRHHGVHTDEVCTHKCSYWVRQGLLEQAAGNRSQMPRCTYEFNSGVMLITPLKRAVFQRRVVQPLRCNQAPAPREGWSRDGGDQGVLNSLVHGLGAMGERVDTLPSKYNGLHRVSALRPQTWRRWDPALVHIVGERKPWTEGVGSWLLPRATDEVQPIGFAAASFEWHRLCPQARYHLAGDG